MANGVFALIGLALGCDPYAPIQWGSVQRLTGTSAVLDLEGAVVLFAARGAHLTGAARGVRVLAATVDGEIVAANCALLAVTDRLEVYNQTAVSGASWGGCTEIYLYALGEDTRISRLDLSTLLVGTKTPPGKLVLTLPDPKGGKWYSFSPKNLEAQTVVSGIANEEECIKWRDKVEATPRPQKGLGGYYTTCEAAGTEWALRLEFKRTVLDHFPGGLYGVIFIVALVVLIIIIAIICRCCCCCGGKKKKSSSSSSSSSPKYDKRRGGEKTQPADGTI